MQNAHRQQEVVYQLTQWAEHQDSVRAMLLTSTRASPHAQVDVFSDYDAILVVRDIRPFFENRAWLSALYFCPFIAPLYWGALPAANTVCPIPSEPPHPHKCSLIH